MFKLFYNYIYYYSSLLFKPTHIPHPKHKNKYFITYNFEGKNYNLLVSKKKGPNRIVSIHGYKDVETEEPLEIFEHIQQFLGPNMDFHNINYTPQCLGYYKIVCTYLDDTTKTWINDEIIEL